MTASVLQRMCACARIHRGLGSVLAPGAWLAAFTMAMTSANASALTTCAILSVTGMNFGPYDPDDGRPVDSTGSVSIRCTGVEPTDLVQIHMSSGSANSSIPRSMTFHSDRLEYNLYLDARRTVVWGDGTGGTSFYSRRPPDGITLSVPIYGRIPPRQNVTAGPYADLVVITVLF